MGQLDVSRKRTIVPDLTRPVAALRWLLPTLILAMACALLIRLFQNGRETVWLEINGMWVAHQTYQRSAEAVLEELGLPLATTDRVQMPASEPFLDGEPIRIHLARQVTVVHDGYTTTGLVESLDVAGALDEMGIVVGPSDRVYVGDLAVDLANDLPAGSTSLPTGPTSLVAELRQPLHLSVQRAVRVTLHESGLAAPFVTAARTVGEALSERGITLYEADLVRPAAETLISEGLTIQLERSLPVSLQADGATVSLRTRAQTVADLLAHLGITLGPKDYVTPNVEAPLVADLRVEVVRISEEYYVEEIPIAYEVRQVPDPELEIDQWRVDDWGREGALRRRVRVLFENGREQYRTEEEEWIALEPQDRIIRYGTMIVTRSESTPSGTITYWRKLRMLATSYNAPTAGKAMDHPQYGITRVGLRARYGIIAVDPRVIPLGQNMYVPGYGQGLAADTGGAIKWRRVDLCYDDHNLILWHRWVDVYLLGPVPSRDQILWIVPNYPSETG